MVSVSIPAEPAAAAENNWSMLYVVHVAAKGTIECGGSLRESAELAWGLERSCVARIIIGI
jgi:hypothetical protein